MYPTVSQPVSSVSVTSCQYLTVLLRVCVSLKHAHNMDGLRRHLLNSASRVSEPAKQQCIVF